MAFRKSNRKPIATFECPHCGAEVKVTAVACRECGSDVETGWQSDEEIDYKSLDIPDGWGDDLDTADADKARATASPPAWAVITALVLVAVLIWWALGRP